jgi:hypothetical protein
LSEIQSRHYQFSDKKFYTGQDDEAVLVYPKDESNEGTKLHELLGLSAVGHAIRREVLIVRKAMMMTFSYTGEELILLIEQLTWVMNDLRTEKFAFCTKFHQRRECDGRTNAIYYLVRNAIYIKLKYNQSSWKLLML